MSNWYSAGQLAAMKLPKLPTSAAGVTMRANKEKWESHKVRAQGGKQGIKTEYLIPTSYCIDFTALPQVEKKAAAPVEIANKPAAQGIVTLTLTVSMGEAAYITGWLAELEQK